MATNYRKTFVFGLLIVFFCSSDLFSQDILVGKYYGTRSGATYSLECEAYGQELYTLRGRVVYSSDNRGYRPSDSHYSYAGRRNNSSIRFTGYCYGTPQEENVPLSTDANTKCELYYEKTTEKYYFVDYKPFGQPYEILYIIELKKEGKKYEKE